MPLDPGADVRSARWRRMHRPAVIVVQPVFVFVHRRMRVESRALLKFLARKVHPQRLARPGNRPDRFGGQQNRSEARLLQAGLLQGDHRVVHAPESIFDDEVLDIADLSVRGKDAVYPATPACFSSATPAASGRIPVAGLWAYRPPAADWLESGRRSAAQEPALSPSPAFPLRTGGSGPSSFPSGLRSPPPDNERSSFHRQRENLELPAITVRGGNVIVEHRIKTS